MLQFFCKYLLRNPAKPALALPIRLFRTPSLEKLSQTTPPPRLIEYLANSCFLSPERALSAARKLKGEIPQHPDSILSLLKAYGLSKTHIQTLVSKRPEVLLLDPESNLRPKLDFFKEIGPPDSVMADYLSSYPGVLFYSLDNRIKPVFDFIRGISGTNEAISRMPRNSSCLFHYRMDKTIVPNVTLLQNCGVPNSRIFKLFITNPKILTLSTDRLGESVRLVMELGFDSSTTVFLEAVRGMGTISRAIWERKFETYRSLGWSDEEILVAFRRHPNCFMISEEKIRRRIAFCTEELGWSPSLLSKNPAVLLFSLEKRIVPRLKVLQALKSMGLVKKSLSPFRSFFLSEKNFLEYYVYSHSEMVPELLKVYRCEVGVTPQDANDGEACNLR